MKATHTITMGFPKLGLCIEPGKSFSGKTESVDIGFPKIEDELNGIDWRLIDSNFVDQIIKPMDSTTNKYAQGKVLVLAGSKGMTGVSFFNNGRSAFPVQSSGFLLLNP